MHKNLAPRLIPALIAIAFSGGASASGFQLLEQNASGLGNSYAGSAAVAENASTIFYNPAGMTQLKGLQVSGGLTAIHTSYKFSDQGSSVGVLQNSGNGGDGGGWGYLPNAYISWEATKDLYLGLGIGAPFGLKTEYNNPWQGGAQSLKFDIKTVNINPSIAWRANEFVSIGAGINYQKASAEYERQVSVSTATRAATKMTLDLDDDAWGWNVGVLFNIAPSTKVGLSYRSAVKYDLTGDIKFDGPVAQNPLLGGAVTNRAAKATLKLPDTWILSATHVLNDRFELLGDISWTGWSSIPKVDVINAQTTGVGAVSGNVAQTLDTDFRDTWRVAAGANYRYTDALKFKFGVAYDQTPVQGASTRLVSLPDNNRIWLSFGTQWKPTKDSALDLGIAHLFVKDSKIDNDQSAAGRGRVTGTFADSAWIFGLQYSAAF
ncbi:MAG: Membrane protein involved in aromatic hydrocarbon degradation [Proteobacteria bacterium]|nr:Membrane protein involved in aromatic hydrocarbon degradation [Pseudomonadota bacterium]